MSSKRLALGCLTALFALVGVVGCGGSDDGGGGGASGGGDPNRPMTMWVRDSSADFTRKIVDSWNKTHPAKIKLTVVPASQFFTKLGTAIAGGSGPDVTAIDFTYVAQFASRNQATDLSERVKELPFHPDGLSKSHLRAGQYEGKTYGLPFSGEASILLYNKSLFKRAGLDPEKPPTTWAEIEEYASKISGVGDGVKGYYFAGRCAGCNTFTFLPYVWASGGDVLSQDGKTATVDTPQMREALAFYNRLWKADVVPKGARSDDGAAWVTAFQTGKVGMVPLGAFGVSAIRAENPKLDFGATYLPGKDGNWSSYAGGDNVLIPAGSKNPDGAWEFIKWMLSTEVQFNELAKRDVVPVRTDEALERFKGLDERYEIAATAETKGRAPYAVPYNALFNDANGPFGQMISQAVFDGDIDGAVKRAQAAFTKVLEESN